VDWRGALEYVACFLCAFVPYGVGRALLTNEIYQRDVVLQFVPAPTVLRRVATTGGAHDRRHDLGTLLGSHDV
jgi:hypothetical protein